ncbi:MAG: 5-formyltetrahydrofolate cyclo-ligase [Pseudomonadota bacterium]
MLAGLPLGIVQWKQVFRERAKAARREAAARQPSAAKHAASAFMMEFGDSLEGKTIAGAPNPREAEAQGADRPPAKQAAPAEAPRAVSEKSVALYHPTGDELDTEPLADALAKRGIAVLLPVVVKKNAPLVFRLFEIDKGLEEGRYGIMQPPESCPEMRPDVIVTPLLGVRRDGARLGMGGGYYDRTLAALRAEGDMIAVGYGFAAQKMDRFPVGPEDQFLDGFVSEQGFERFPRRNA